MQNFKQVTKDMPLKKVVNMRANIEHDMSAAKVIDGRIEFPDRLFLPRLLATGDSVAEVKKLYLDIQEELKRREDDANGHN